MAARDARYSYVTVLPVRRRRRAVVDTASRQHDDAIRSPAAPPTPPCRVRELRHQFVVHDPDAPGHRPAPRPIDVQLPRLGFEARQQPHEAPVVDVRPDEVFRALPQPHPAQMASISTSVSSVRYAGEGGTNWCSPKHPRPRAAARAIDQARDRHRFEFLAILPPSRRISDGAPTIHIGNGPTMRATKRLSPIAPTRTPMSICSSTTGDGTSDSRKSGTADTAA